MTLIEHSDSPRSIRLHPLDNVAVVVNDQGVPALNNHEKFLRITLLSCLLTARNAFRSM